MYLKLISHLTFGLTIHTEVREKTKVEDGHSLRPSRIISC
jgi:hypothetical protein